MVQSYEQLYLDELTRRAHVAPAASNRFAHGR
jgi:hypothetical protein